MARNIHWEKNIGRRLQLRELNVFATVANHSNMAKAAVELGITQPSVSAVIAELETALGVRLFDRGPRGVEITPFGRILLVRAQAAFDELRQSIRDIEFLNDSGRGVVRIGCPESVAAGFLPELLTLVSEKYPRMSVVVEHFNAPTFRFPALEERKIDLAIALLATTNPTGLPGEYETEILFDDPQVIVVGDAHPLARRRKIKMAELSGEDWVIAPLSTAGASRVVEAFRADGASFPERCIFTFSGHIRNHLLASGRFVGTMRVSAFDLAARQFPLKRLPLEMEGPPGQVAVIRIRNRTVSPVVNLFLECARQVAKSRIRQARLT